MMRQALLACCAALLVQTAGVRQAGGQPRAEGFALNRFEPSERGSEWFSVESLDLRGRGRFAMGVVFDYGHRPLVLYGLDGAVETAIVEHQLFSHVGGSIILWDRVRFAVSLPVALVQDGQAVLSPAGEVASDHATTVGDLRLGSDVRLLGRYGDAVTVSGGVQVFAPTGSTASFTGDGAWRVIPRLNVAGDVSPFVYAAQAGFKYRARDDDFAGSPTGSEVVFAAAAGARLLDGRLVVGPEAFGATVVAHRDAFLARRTTPVELLLGGHYSYGELRFGAGAGPGLTRGFGTPAVRALLSVEWVEAYEPPPLPPPPKPTDRDGDGIYDAEDACPDEPGVRTGDPETNGCPPPRDRDGDGIIDAEDACPDEPGVPTDEPETNGCPAPRDRDGDGILDGEDACPDVPGPPSADPARHGCPVARVEQEEIKIREQVQFAYDSDRILGESDFILEAVLEILAENPDILLVSVEGHTDEIGSKAYNQDLSERRARSVVRWLVDRGVEEHRLQSIGFGKERPIDTNETEEGRGRNRRVELHILDRQEAAAPP